MTGIMITTDFKGKLSYKMVSPSVSLLWSSRHKSDYCIAHHSTFNFSTGFLRGSAEQENIICRSKHRNSDFRCLELQSRAFEDQIFEKNYWRFTLYAKVTKCFYTLMNRE